MYPRGKKGHWTIRVGGRRVSSGTADKARAKRKEALDNARLWDKAQGFVVLTWADACNSWIDANPGPAKLYSNEKYLTWWKPHLRGKQLTEINRVLIHNIISREFKTDPLERLPQNATANGYVSFVSRIIRHGSGIRPDFIHYPRIRFRERYLRPDEWRQLAAVLDVDSLDVFTYLLSTGIREANAMFLEWSWIDGEIGTIPAARFKSRRPHSYPLNRTAQAVIERRREAKTKHMKYVFTREGGKPWYRGFLIKKLHEACTKAGIEDITPHGLRHTYTTWLAKAGVPQEIRMRLTGHSLGGVHDGYTHLDVEALRPHAEVIDRILNAQVQKIAEAS